MVYPSQAVEAFSFLRSVFVIFLSLLQVVSMIKLPILGACAIVALEIMMINRHILYVSQNRLWELRNW